MLNNFFLSPLEQFTLLPVKFCPFIESSSFTNETIILLLISIFFYFFYKALLNPQNSLLIIPSNYQLVIEFFFTLISSIIQENIKHKDKAKYFPLILTIFLIVLTLNLIGLIPYSYTLTSQLVITLTLSCSFFIGINIISVKKNGLKFFTLFLPAGTNLALAFLLIPIELISYIFKPISLAVRLFANMMAGHTLLKVIAGFASTLTIKGGFFSILSFFPLVILIPLFGLELAVALIQSYVFVVLVSIYIQDSISVAH